MEQVSSIESPRKSRREWESNFRWTSYRQEVAEEVYRLRSILLPIPPFSPLRKCGAGPLGSLFSVSGRQEGNLALTVFNRVLKTSRAVVHSNALSAWPVKLVSEPGKGQ